MKKTCPTCHKEYKKGRSFNQHKKYCGQRFSCPHCPQVFVNPSNKQKHIRNLHPDSQLKGGRLPSYIPEATKRTGTKRVAEEDDIKPSPKKLLMECSGTKRTAEEVFEEAVLQVELSPPTETKRKLVDYDPSSDEEDYFQSQGDGDNLCNQAYSEMFPDQPITDDQPSTQEEYRDLASQQTGGALGPLFQFRFNQIGPRRRWLNVTQGVQYHAELHYLRDPLPGDNIGVALSEALFNVIHDEMQHHPRAHYVNFSITAHGFTHAFQSINFEVSEFLTRSYRLDDMLRTLSGKLNSNESFDPQRGFQLDIVFVDYPPAARGRGHKRQVGLQCLEKVNNTKHCIIPMNNSDDLCCARAIVTMKAWADKEDKKQQLQSEQKKDTPDPHLIEQLTRQFKEEEGLFKTLRKARGNNTRQHKLAKILHRQAGVPEGPCGLEEWARFQAHLSPSYQLQVMCRSKPFALLFQGEPAPKQINLLKGPNHMDGCTSFPAFVNRSYWCSLCGKGYDHEDAKHHPCEGRMCRACHSKTCPDYERFKTPQTYCPQCNGWFYGPACLEQHKNTKQCDSFKHCLKCQAQYQVIQGKPHRCFYATCPSCKETVNIQDHKCFIQPLVDDPEPEEDEEGNKKKPPLEPLFVYADIEAMTMPDRSFEINLLCYRSHEEDQIHSLWGKQGCLEFLERLDALTEVPGDERTRPIIIIFHNLKGFDGMFILYELYGQCREVEKQMTVGAKVLCFKSGPLTFKDSLCFLTYPLSAFPTTFGLREKKKGYFPHAFNTPDNQQYVGPIPDKSYYDPDGMNDKEKKAFEEWYDRQVREEVVYDFKKELEAYCRSDVDLLQRGCEAFCKEFDERAGFNPFGKCVTIAASCHDYWRRHHLPLDTIAVEPLRGWRGANVNQSKKALQWLYYQESLIPKQGACADRIKHVRNGGEQTVFTETDPYFVDGFDPVTNTVYEFHGCLWHGCKHCFRNNRQVKHTVNPDRTLTELYQHTQVKMTALRQAGKQVIEIWECEWEKQVKENPSVKAFVDQLDLVEPLEPRDAFFGGRTGAVSLYANTQGEEEIHYADVTSLYPWVNKTQEYPVGHPHIITNPTNQCMSDYFGVAQVDILPPSGLFHPVLPVRSGNKLTFPLCATCVGEEQAKPMLERSEVCTHTDEERMLRGTWCTPEIMKALEVGYTLHKIHEVWHFPPHQRQTGLFKDYVNTWLKIKQESAGWPRWCDTEDKKTQYLQDYLEVEGIELERHKVKKNPGRKATAKLMLNSFWGKFGERQNKATVVAVQTPASLYALLDDETKEISTLRICTEDVMEVVYTHVKENVCPSHKINVFVAAFTTCHARLKLYSYLHLLQRQVLYYDTDSVIYKWAPGLEKIPTGDYLGEMTDELEGDPIVEFVSGGAKNYGYHTQSGKHECKVRGFTLNVRGSKVLNYDSMKRNILNELKDPLEKKRVIEVTNPSFFVRNTTDKTIHLQKRTKNYSLVFDKRVLCKDSDVNNQQSVPYGFRRVREEMDLLMEL